MQRPLNLPPRNCLKLLLKQNGKALSLSLFLLLAIAIIFTAVTAFRQYSDSLVERNARLLSSIAGLKANDIGRHIQERFSDARIFAGRPPVAWILDKTLQPEKRMEAEKYLENASRATREAYGYNEIMVVDDKLKVVFPGALVVDGPVEIEAIRSAISTGHSMLVDLHPTAEKTFEYGVAYPVFSDDGPARKVLGAVFLEIDAADKLFREVRNWPIPDSSGEAVLLDARGDHVEFLNPLKNDPSVRPLSLKRPLADRRLLSAQAVGNPDDTILSGIDYRGIDAFAATRAVEGTPWIVMAKIDQSEIRSELDYFGKVASLVAAAMLLAVAGFSWMLMRLRTNERQKLDA